MVTYVVHMRDPVLLLKQLGAVKFAGFQIMFLGTISQVLLVPVLWSFWALPFGLHHPIGDVLPTTATHAIALLFFTTEIITIATGMIGLRRSGQKISLLWVPTLQIYYPLAALASYKALLEVITKPFYWDKTSHGIFDH